MALTEKNIRERIFEKILAICPDAKRIKRNPFSRARSEWIGLFTHEVEVENATKTVTHAWVVRRANLKKAVKSGFDRFTFEILGFYGFDYGTAENNSEDRWQPILDAIADAFADKDIENPVWEFTGEAFEDEEDEVTTEEMEFGTIGLIRTGDNEYLHFGGGRLVVNIHRC